MRFTHDRRGQSVVIGTVILFGFLILALSLYQVQVVPQQNGQTEFEHFEDVQNDLVELRSGILSAGQSERPQFVDVKLGTNYQTRLFAINPPDPAGTLQTSQRYNITINDSSGTTVNVSTRFVRYRPGYNELRVGSIWYDNSVLYLDERDSGSRAVIIEDQNLVTDNDTLRITALQNEFQTSGTRRVALELYPADDDNVDSLSALNGTLDVKIPTRISEADGYWNESIENGSVTYQGMNNTAYPSDSEVSALLLQVNSPDNITVNSVGIQSEPSENAVRDNVGPAGGVATSDNGAGGGEDTLPSGAVAYDDADENGQYDDGETTYTASELQNFDREVNLVVARSTTVDSYDITADALTVNTGVTMVNQFGSVSLATNSGGEIRIRGTIDTTNNVGSSIGLDGDTVNIRDGSLLSSGSVSLSTSVGDITVDDATIDTTTGSGQSITFDAENGFSGVNAQIYSSGSVSLSTSVGDITVDDATIDTTAGSGQSITFDAENGVSGVNAQITSSGSVSVTSNADSITFNDAILDVTDGSQQAITLTTADELSIESTRLIGDEFSTFTGERDNNGRSVFVNNAIFERGNGDPKEFDVSPGSRTGNGNNPPQNVNGTPQKGIVV